MDAYKFKLIRKGKMYKFDIAEDIIYMTLCSNMDVRHVEEPLLKNIVHPFYCAREDVPGEYNKFLEVVLARLQCLSKSNKIVFKVSEPRIVDHCGNVGGYFEIFWLEEEIYVEKYLRGGDIGLDVDMRKLSII